MFQITYKENLFTPKPYPTSSIEDYLKLIIDRKDSLNESFGVYLAREVIFNGQKLYFPFIDVDGDVGLDQEDLKIESAIYNTHLTYNILKELGVADFFYLIATGGSGFRIMSNILLNINEYKAFVDIIKHEFIHIHDTRPTEDIEMSYQIFAYKGNQKHNPKILVNRHSVFIDYKVFEQSIQTADEYRQLTANYLNPYEVIDFLRHFFKFQVVSDLSILGKFGQLLKDYQEFTHGIKINTFDITRLKKKKTNLSIEAVGRLLKEKNKSFKITEIKGRQSISFKGHPCPVCGKTTANAWAYSPGFTLYCFNKNCPANEGMPFSAWYGGKIDYKSVPSNNNKDHFNLIAPTKFVSIPEARIKIMEEIEKVCNSIIVVTFGVGKTSSGIEDIVKKK
ncbi:MAG: hypothetical protein V1872_05530 [bacterium]